MQELCDFTGVPSLSEVQAKIHELEERFNVLKKSSREGLKLRRISVENVVECLTELPADDKEEHRMYLERHMNDLLQADSLFKLFLHLNLYWNYLTYHLLEHIITKFSVEEVKVEMKKYKSDLQQFMWDTPLEMFRQAQKERVMDLPEGFEKLVTKFDWPENVTLAVVEIFRQRYAYHYKLHDCAMMIMTVRTGSFTVVWCIPESIVEHLINMHLTVAEDILSKYEVTRLEIAQVCVYKQVIICCSFI